MSSETPSPSAERDERLYVADMLQFCERAIEYTRGRSLDEVLADRMRYDATLRNLELIGEAATHVGAAVRAQAPGIPWRQVVGTRNRVVHAYLGLEVETLWSIITERLPVLRDELRALLAAIGGEPHA